MVGIVLHKAPNSKAKVLGTTILCVYVGLMRLVVDQNNPIQLTYRPCKCVDVSVECVLVNLLVHCIPHCVVSVGGIQLPSYRSSTDILFLYRLRIAEYRASCCVYSGHAGCILLVFVTRAASRWLVLLSMHDCWLSRHKVGEKLCYHESHKYFCG